MREIRFRAMNFGGYWIKSSKVGLSVLFDYLECDDPVIRKDTLGQYTGLKDKNGREIYEGDILSIAPQGEERHYRREEVKFVEGSFVAGMYFTFIHFSGVTIIGNIHENPDLVNPEKGVGK